MLDAQLRLFILLPRLALPLANLVVGVARSVGALGHLFAVLAVPRIAGFQNLFAGRECGDDRVGRARRLRRFADNAAVLEALELLTNETGVEAIAFRAERGLALFDVGFDRLSIELALAPGRSYLCEAIGFFGRQFVEQSVDFEFAPVARVFQFFLFRLAQFVLAIIARVGEFAHEELLPFTRKRLNRR